MGRKKEDYVISVHYPEADQDIVEMRRRMGDAYIGFVEEYILALPVGGKQKNDMYTQVVQYLRAGTFLQKR
ncbi:hypothetical protein DFR58_1432 [Anaerobacterium chartisolvens]|uniref:Uncharacterized protein n=1 Tax=Anaerobacterium chartisolvens TaxID=1297424 RepID=A0A369AG16_9FIRM|nr:hypothetical protein [Anaerobacterium chartisolvens]RCX08290.1 hypothetical protein DFR58_1432 [Anaerobacterium chartisolvens]